MDLNNIPTKGNLLGAKSTLAMATQSHNLLEKKKQVAALHLIKVNQELNQALDNFYTQAVSAWGLMAQVSPWEDTGFNLWETTTTTDEAYKAWCQLEDILFNIVKIKAEAHRLTTQLKKATKRAAALENIVIPKFEASIKHIASQLEERERDEINRVSKHINAYGQSALHL